jgi:hypothetical protein
MVKKSHPMTFRLPADLAGKLLSATIKSKNPYAPTVTAVVERGVVLALKEMKVKNEMVRRSYRAS